MSQGLQKEHDPLPGGTHLYTHSRPGSRNAAHQNCGKTRVTQTISPPLNAKECKPIKKHPTFTQPGTTSLIEAVGPRSLPTNLTTNSKTDLQPLQSTTDSRQCRPDCPEMGKRRPKLRGEVSLSLTGSPSTAHRRMILSFRCLLIETVLIIIRVSSVTSH